MKNENDTSNERNTTMSLKEFIGKSEPHGVYPQSPPHDKNLRHSWESKILYSVKDSLLEGCSLLEFGCGNQTLKRSLVDRYPNAEYYGVDPKLTNMSLLSDIIPTVDCCVAGSVFTHLPWESIERILDDFAPMFENGGQFGFTFFLDDDHKLYNGPTYYGDNTYHVVTTTTDQYENYCNDKKLKFTLLPFDHKLCHLIQYDGTILSCQNFGNIKK